MSDYDQTCAVWFTANVLLPSFQSHGKDAHFNNKTIKQLNKSICDFFLSKSLPQTAKPPGSGSKCSECQAIFRSNQQPTPCGACGHFYHKTTCLKSHDCQPTPRTPAASNARRARLQSEPAISLSTSHRGHVVRSEMDSFSGGEEVVEETALLSPPPVLHSTPVHLRPSALTHVVSSSTNPSSNTVDTISSSPSSDAQVPTGQQYLQTILSQPGQQQQQPLIPEPGHQSGPGLPALHAPPPPGTQPTALVPTTYTAPLPQPPRQKGRQRRSGPAITEAGLEKELIERELTLARVKITSLDSRLSEEQSRSAILLERVRIFEKRENDVAYSRYFGPSVPPLSPVSAQNSDPATIPLSPQPATDPPSSTQCPAPPPVDSTAPPPVGSTSPPSCCPSSSLLLQSLATLQAEVAGLKGSMTHVLSALSDFIPSKTESGNVVNSAVSPHASTQSRVITATSSPAQVQSSPEPVLPEAEASGPSASDHLGDFLGPPAPQARGADVLKAPQHLTGSHKVSKQPSRQLPVGPPGQATLGVSSSPPPITHPNPRGPPSFPLEPPGFPPPLWRPPPALGSRLPTLWEPLSAPLRPPVPGASPSSGPPAPTWRTPAPGAPLPNGPPAPLGRKRSKGRRGRGRGPSQPGPNPPQPEVAPLIDLNF